MLPRTVRVAALAAALAALAVPAAPATASDELRRCREVHFTRGSDDVAGAIRVRNLTCRYARRFIRHMDGRPPRRHHGWRCRTRFHDPDMGIPYWNVRCTKGDKLIRWRKT